MKKERKISQEPNKIGSQRKWLKHKLERTTKQSHANHTGKSSMTRLSSLKKSTRNKSKEAVKRANLGGET